MGIVEITKGLLIDLEKIRHYVKIRFKEDFKEFNLNYNLYLILFYIRFFPVKTQYDMSKELHINRSGINKYIKKAEELGYLVLNENTRGKVVIKNLEVTSKGIEILDTIVNRMFIIEEKRNINLEEAIILLINKKLNKLDDANLTFDSEKGLLITIERFLNFIYDYLNTSLEKEGINTKHYLIMNYLKNSGNETLQKEIMTTFNFSKQNMNFLVKYLVEEGLVEDSFLKVGNRQVKSLSLNRTGQKRLDEVHKKSQIIFRKFFSVEDLIDLRVITNLLNLLTESLNLKNN